ncbi:MAG: Cys-tRNA(Pro) deacylase [Clostridiales bacterium]|nr:MAG: Cys-tRNA(Pro) deacylase [Clostridiales bacterium]
MDKTNAARKLDALKITYKEHFYSSEEAISGVEVASVLGQDPGHVFKTLVTTGKTGTHYVFMVPVAEELNLKKAAAAVGEKNIEMLKAKDLLPLTGYIHGGCSPLGMKKTFRTVIHNSAEEFDTIMCSGGKIGYQIELPLSSLQKVVKIETADII